MRGFRGSVGIGRASRPIPVTLSKSPRVDLQTCRSGRSKGVTMNPVVHITVRWPAVAILLAFAFMAAATGIPSSKR
jgi:hypothetical protein